MNAMRSNPRRLLSAAVAIFIGVAFVAATLVLGDTFKATLGRDAAGQVGDSAVVVTTSRSVGEPISAAYVDAVRATPGVASARPSVVRYVTQQAGNGGVSLRLSTVPPLTATTRLTAGRLPQAAGEIAVNTVVVDNRGVALGQHMPGAQPGMRVR